MLASGPKILTSLPGPRSRELSERLAAVECREVTCLYHATNWWLERAIEGADDWPPAATPGEDLFL